MGANAEGVSVPLRGKGRDQRVAELKKLDKSIKFPSPCGEKVGINAFKDPNILSLY